MTGKNFVGFDHSAKGNSVFQTFNPQTNTENQTVFTEATEDELNSAVLLAENAFFQLQKIPSEKRAEFLFEIASQIEQLGDELLQCFVNESGLSIERAKAERSRTLKQIQSFAELVLQNQWIDASIDIVQNPAKTDLRKMLIGIGPVAVFGASNFPLAYSTAGGDTISAFAAGCPVIVKAHPFHAGTGELVSSAIITAAKKTGMPNGIFSNLNARSFEIGEKLVLHPKIKAVGFTGSLKGGRALFDLANSRPEPIPVFAEMGSVNPVIFLPEQLKEKAEDWSKNYADSITSGTGQFCTNPGLLFLLKDENAFQFLELLKDQILLKESSCMLHPSIVLKYEKGIGEVKEHKEVSLSEKEGEIAEHYARQAIATVDAATFLNNDVLQNEIFGPVSIAILCDNSNQLLKCIENLHGQLTGTILGTDLEFLEYDEIIQVLKNKVGRLIFNGVPTGVEVCPSMNHGGPYPASTDVRFTAVGTDSIKRFARPIAFQNCPQSYLPVELKNENIKGINRRINGVWTKEKIS